MIEEPKFGPTGQAVYERTYQRVKPNGERENWSETVERVISGNLSLVYGPEETWSDEVIAEFNALAALMFQFKVLPAGRHLWASGVPGRQYLFNCHVSGWGEKFSDHFEFTFMRLMEGGGVGANYSSRFLKPYGPPKRPLNVHIVCDPEHPDYEALKAAGLLSESYDSDWTGSFAVEDSREGWAAALVDLLDTYYLESVAHHNRVYDVSNVREAGRRLKTFGGTASGPQPFAKMMLDIGTILNRAATFNLFTTEDYVTPIDAMDIDHAIAECVVSGGNRRSARMSILEWNDPFISDFIKCKANPNKNWSTNISVAIDDEFIAALDDSESQASQVHKAAVAAMLANGEPGYWNRSLSQVGEVGEVIATNPCGEITLEAWENCNLGHVNLQAFVDKTGRVDWNGLDEAHRLMTRFLMRATYGDVNDAKQADRLATNRRIGVGHFGVQGFLAKRGIKWSEAHTEGFGWELADLYDVVRGEARKYAFALRVPEPVKVTTVAPTGSIAKLPGVSEGIHPIYARYFIRRVRFSTIDREQAKTLIKYERDGFKVEDCLYAANTGVVEFPTKDSLLAEIESMGLDPRVVESADQISLDAMLRFQAMYQQHWADNAVSFTANIPEGEYSPDEVSDLLKTWLPYLKGTTLMPDGTRPQAPYERLTEAGYYDAVLSGLAGVSDGIDEECANGACPVR